MDDVVFGFDDVAGYESKANGYFGATTGRVANRIAGGKFTIDGKEYTLAKNDGPNTLHGGVKRSLEKSFGTASRSRMQTARASRSSTSVPMAKRGFPASSTIKRDIHAH